MCEMKHNQIETGLFGPPGRFRPIVCDLIHHLLVHRFNDGPVLSDHINRTDRVIVDTRILSGVNQLQGSFGPGLMGNNDAVSRGFYLVFVKSIRLVRPGVACSLPANIDASRNDHTSAANRFIMIWTRRGRDNPVIEHYIFDSNRFEKIGEFHVYHSSVSI
ncbi:hypothetical protein D3C77_567450 [compost metagenome]